MVTGNSVVAFGMRVSNFIQNRETDAGDMLFLRPFLYFVLWIIVRMRRQKYYLPANTRSIKNSISSYSRKPVNF